MSEWIHKRNLMRRGEWSFTKAWGLVEVRLTHDSDDVTDGMEWTFYGRLASPYFESEYDRAINKFYDDQLDGVPIKKAMSLMDTFVVLEGWA